MADLEIEIDGKKLTAKPNQTVIQVADEAGIYIPRFCYHKHLSVAANCRMCLVEVEKAPKALPACATPVTPGMKVFTRSPKTIEAQRAVMEFLLINHPLDCPVCDQGGECELQDLAMGYGSAHSHYNEPKRAVADEDLGPLVETEMTRCILCTRCVRFGEELAGFRELGVTERGGHAEIKTFVKQMALVSEVSGNIIDLCPVGALTSKPFRFRSRPWELDQAPSISPHDCVGSNLHVHTRYGQVMRVVSKENLAINEMWISDRDRFSYTGIYHQDRVQEPMIRVHGEWQVVDWETALKTTAEGLHQVIAEFGSDKLGGLASPNSTLEEFYLLQKIIRTLGSPHIDHRLREMNTQDQASMGAFPGLTFPLAELENAEAILLMGSNIQKEQPVAFLRIRKASLKGASVSAINPVAYKFPFSILNQYTVAPHEMAKAIASVINVFDAQALRDLSDEYQQTNDTAKIIAENLRGKKGYILLGALAAHHPEAPLLRYLAQKLAEVSGAQIGLMTDGANSAGAWLAGAVPHRHADGSAINHAGLNAYEMMEKPRKGYLLLNVEPEFDMANAAHAVAALKQAKFTVALSMYRNPVLDAHAHVILPIGAFTETSGTFVNVDGHWQSFVGSAKPFHASRPAWKVLRVLGNYLHLNGFDYESSEKIKHEVKGLSEKMPAMTMQLQPVKPASSKPHLSRIGEVPLYATDSLVRRAAPLQASQMIMLGDCNVVRLHPKTAEKLNLQDGQMVKVKQHSAEVSLPLILDDRIALDAALIPAAVKGTETLGDLMGEVELKR